MYRRVLLFNQSFHWIADMFKEIMDAVKSNILLLSVVPLLSISCLLLDYESIFYYSFIFAFFFGCTFLHNSFCIYHRDDNMHFFNALQLYLT